MSRHMKHHRHNEDSSSYSSSDSDSDSEGSYDSERMMRNTYVRAGTTMAPAGNMMVPVAGGSATSASASASTSHYDILPYTPTRVASPADTVRNFVAPGTAQNASAKRRVTASFDILTTYGNLRRQGDGGKHLVIDTKSNALRPADIIHSKPVDPSELGTSVDFPTRIEMKLDHNVDTSLMVQTPVRALKSEADHVFPGSQTAENPHGLIALRFPLGSNTATFERNVSEGQMNWMNTFGGQSGDDAKKWVSTINNNADMKLLQVKPPSGVAYFYNKNMADPSQHVTEAMADKTLGTVVVRAADADKAVADYEAAMADSINYSNLSDKNEIALKVGLAPRTVLNEQGAGKHTSVHLADAFKHTAAFARTKTAAADKPDPAQFLANAEKSVLRNGHVELRGTMAIDYFHVDKNFRFAPRD